jgi:hypothetical protein
LPKVTQLASGYWCLNPYVKLLTLYCKE